MDGMSVTSASTRLKSDHENQNAEPYGYQAKKYNEKLVLSKTVRLEFDKERL